MAADMAALKDWVTARDSEQFSRLPVGVVSVNISHSNITARMIELKFDLSQTVSRTPVYRREQRKSNSLCWCLQHSGETF